MDETSTDEVGKEVQVSNQPTATGIGYVDYVLWDDDGKPLAVIEAKRTRESVEKGREQAKLYADALAKQYGQRPVIFYSNGYDIRILDDAQGYNSRKLYGYYSKDSLQYLINIVNHLSFKQPAQVKPGYLLRWLNVYSMLAGPNAYCFYVTVKSYVNRRAMHLMSLLTSHFIS